MLEISAAAAATIHAHAEEGYPLEICGLLVGTVRDDVRRVTDAWPVRNAWETDPEARATLVAGLEREGDPATAEAWESQDSGRRFFIDPREIMLAMKRARGFGWDLVGVYHTHPNHPAVPSVFDRSAASPYWSYVIVSVREEKVAEFRSWVIDGDEGPFVEEQIAEY